MEDDDADISTAVDVTTSGGSNTKKRVKARKGALLRRYRRAWPLEKE